MDVKELMKGDWVLQDDTLHQNRPCQIAGIYNDVIIDVTGEKVPLHESHLKPIPLTKEILEKNGFTDGKYRHFNGNVWKLEADGFREIHLTEKVRQAVLWGEKINPDYPSSVGDKFTIPFIRYVHELQHAMKLCGIKKDIVI